MTQAMQALVEPENEGQGLQEAPQRDAVAKCCAGSRWE